MPNNERAKYLFLKYLGNRENMKEDNCLEEYEKFKIPTDLEIEWKNEFIHEQFIKADLKDIKVNQLISNLCGILYSFKEVCDVKKLLSIKEKYLREADLFEQVTYFQKALNAMLIVTDSNNDISREAKLELVCELEDMLKQTINQEGCLPDKLYEKITQKYGVENKSNYIITKLTGIYDLVSEIKEMMLKVE